MKYSSSFIQLLKDNITLSDLVRPAIGSWDRKKSNAARQDWWAPCPFHQEKTSSFHVDDRKGFYHCFGCGAHGNAIDWIKEHHKKTFPEAIEELASIAGISLPEQTPRMKENYDKSKRLYELLEKANSFFQENLYSENGREALNYLTKKRNLPIDKIKYFSLGYAPNNRDLLLNHLKSEAFSENEIKESGIIITPEDKSNLYDRFRNRIIFPVLNRSGKIITFGGRALNNEAKAKYLNGSETLIFNKSNNLYNIDKAIKSRSKNPLIIVEGYMDVIALDKYGFDTAVAPMGTAITESQINLLWRFSNEPIFCFDGDKAGLEAAWRSIDKVLPVLKAGFSARFIFLPDNMDPDDFLKKKTKLDFENLLNKSYSLCHILFARETSKLGIDTPERIMGTEKRLFEAINVISDPRLKALYERDIRTRLSKVSNNNEIWYKSKSHKYQYNQSKTPPSHALSKWKKTDYQKTHSIYLVEAKIIGIYIYFGNILEGKYFENLESISFKNKELIPLRYKIMEKFWENSEKALEKEKNKDIVTIHEKSPEAISWQESFYITSNSPAFNESIESLRFVVRKFDLQFINHNQTKSVIETLCGELIHMHHKMTVLKEEISQAQNDFFKSLCESSQQRLIHLQKTFNEDNTI